jgi:hypothetical protein
MLLPIKRILQKLTSLATEELDADYRRFKAAQRKLDKLEKALADCKRSLRDGMALKLIM